MTGGHHACLLYPATENNGKEDGMAGGGGVLDGRCEAGQGHRRSVPIYFPRRVYRRCPLLIAATNQSELSLIQGIVPKNDR